MGRKSTLRKTSSTSAQAQAPAAAQAQAQAPVANDKARIRWTVNNPKDTPSLGFDRPELPFLVRVTPEDHVNLLRRIVFLYVSALLQHMDLTEGVRRWVLDVSTREHYEEWLPKCRAEEAKKVEERKEFVKHKRIAQFPRVVYVHGDSLDDDMNFTAEREEQFRLEMVQSVGEWLNTVMRGYFPANHRELDEERYIAHVLARVQFFHVTSTYPRNDQVMFNFVYRMVNMYSAYLETKRNDKNPNPLRKYPIAPLVFDRMVRELHADLWRVYKRDHPNVRDVVVERFCWNCGKRYEDQLWGVSKTVPVYIGDAIHVMNVCGELCEGFFNDDPAHSYAHHVFPKLSLTALENSSTSC